MASKKWVFGGFECTLERKLFAVVVDDHSIEMLDIVMKGYFRSNSIIYSDEWNGFTKLVGK